MSINSSSKYNLNASCGVLAFLATPLTPGK